MNASAHLVTLFDVGSHAPHGSSLSLVTCHPCTCASLLEFTSLFFYFDLSFTILSLFFPLMHFEQHTELDNLIVMQNLRTSANKGSDDAYDVSVSLTYNAITSSLLQVGSICGLGPDVVGIHSISLAAGFGVAACSSTLRRGLEKVSEARVHNCTLLFALSPAWEQEFLLPSMTFHTANAFDIVCRLDRDDSLDEVPQNKKQKVATSLLLDKMRTQDFAGPIACRASRVLGPISRHRVADILHHMKKVSCASRPGLLVGFLRILSHGLCIERRFHTVENDHTCRVGCPGEPDFLSLQ